MSSSLDTLTTTYGAHQSTLQSLIEARQRLDSQLSENLQVQRDLPQPSSDDAVVYKLIGGVLLKQETEEARGNVEKRIEYIKGEVKRVEGQIGDKGREAERVRGEILKIQQQQQQQGQGQAGSAQAAA